MRRLLCQNRCIITGSNQYIACFVAFSIIFAVYLLSFVTGNSVLLLCAQEDQAVEMRLCLIASRTGHIPGVRREITDSYKPIKITTSR